ncbi:MAG: hypothetical protein HDS16_05225 [Bacteroides sp.]|nr:hypothetical protein [Bacteroides sp.]
MAENENKVVLHDLKQVMELMGEAYFYNREIKPEELTETTNILDAADFEMPLGDDGVNFDVGDPEITRKKITEGQNWITYAKRGDDDISFQVPSFADKMNELWMHKKTSTAVKAKVEGDVYEGAGYSLKPKKVVGAWVFRNPEHTITVLLPLSENYGTFKGAKGDSEGYYNVAVTPMPNSADVDIYILHKTQASSDSGANGE